MKKQKIILPGNVINNPYILFKDGALAFELNMITEANEILLMAYMLLGQDNF